MTDKTDIEAFYPLSPMQQGMLFHSLRDPESGQYFIQMYCGLEGEVDVDAFEQSWQQVVTRHSILRTAFVWKRLDGMLQVVGRTVKLPLARADWRDLSQEAQRQEFAALLAEDRRRGFELSRAPLMRLTLIQLGEARYKFLWSYHHLIMDGWSMPIVFRELLAHYNALTRGEPVQLPPAPAYREYIDWLQRQDLSEAEKFWREYLRGFSAATKLPSDSADSAVAAGAVGHADDYAERRVRLSPEDTAAVQAAARHHYVTLNTIAQGAWALLLHSYAGARDVVFGSTVAGRPAELPNAQSIVGLFINTLPVRARIDPSEQLGSYLRRLQKQQAEAQRYDFTPLVDIQGWSELSRRVPLFESLVVFENYPVDSALNRPATQNVGFSIDRVQGIERLNYPLALVVSPVAGLTAKAIFDQRHFSASFVERALSHFENLLIAIAAAAPDLRIGLLPLITERERRQVLSDWNATGSDYAGRDCLHEHIEKQAARTPDACAVAFEDQVMTYATLRARANRLANHLRRRGVGPETRVAICAERSFNLVIGLLAILKAGGAYVPLDPEYPPELLGYIFRDAQAPVLLADRTGRERVANTEAVIVSLEDDQTLIDNESADAPEPLATEENLAYVIYTSGSTGRPKGAMNNHRAIVNRLLWMQQAYDLSAADRVLQKTPFSFDVSVWEFFWPLMTGACLVLARPGGHRDSGYLAGAIADHEITTLHFVPSMLQVFLSEPEVEGCRTVRRAICSGEALSADLARQFFTRMVGDLHNLYGPTETAVDVTAWACEPGDPRGFVPIGRPIANTRAYVLSADGRLAAQSIDGELHIGGVAVGRGYLNQPALTAAKFIPDRFSSEPGARLYATGDVVRWLNDGTLQYLGRNDHQVKIHGVRIELGELDSILASHPGVRQCAVIALDDELGDKRLVAYVASREPRPSIPDLSAHLRERTPSYVTVSAFVILDDLPLTPNGKLDRGALPRAQVETCKRDNTGAALRPAEEILTGIWEAVLRRENIGIHDNFFDLGGHSLLATQIVSRVRRALNVELPLKAIFEAPTIEELTARIVQGSKARLALHAREASIVPVGDAQQLSFAQERTWFLEQFDPGSPVHHVSFELRLRGDLDVGELARAVGEILRRHELLRARFPERDGDTVQCIDEPQPPELCLVDLSSCSGQEAQARLLANQMASQPFDLSRGPLLRSALLRLSSLDHILSMTMHRMISDDASSDIFARELCALYRQPEHGGLSELKFQYSDFARWQREWIRGEVLADHIAYWRERLAGAARLELAYDHPRTAAGSHPRSATPIQFSPELATGLHELARSESVTLLMVLLSAVQAVLGRCASQSDISVGLETDSRNVYGADSLIGPLCNHLVIRSRPDGGQTFRELLRQVRESVLGAADHDELPFEKLIDELMPERDLSRPPLFQTKVAFFRPSREEIEMVGLEVEPSFASTGVTELDLTFIFEEREEYLSGTLEYAADLFDEVTARLMAQRLETLLTAALEDPACSLRDLPVLTPAERNNLLVEWNHATVADSDRCLHDLFTSQAARAPDAVAVSCASGELTYEELDRRSNQLARYLQQLGAGPEARVAICVQRDVSLIVGLLGILKSGACYVPLSPSDPGPRLELIIEETQPVVVITDQAHATMLAGVKTVLLDADWRKIERESPLSVTRSTEPGNIAYIMFTSGSTGRPKGVMIEHRNVVAFIRWCQSEYTGDFDEVLAGTSYCFDISIFEIFFTLSIARRIRLMESGLEIAAYLDGPAKVLINTVPSIIQQHLNAGVKFDNAYSINNAGEAMPLALLQQLDGVKVRDVYGPTETTVYSTIYHYGDERTRVLIGRPIDGTQVYVLDDSFDLAPVGSIGELCISGAGVARGYLLRPDLTAERFVCNPWAMGQRLYRTGDRARWLAEGQLEYLGRADHQVKIRGFRIELGEIETVLARHPDISKCTVLAREDEPGEKRLVAYYVSHQPPSDDDLREHLRAHLPLHMTPECFVRLDQMPLTPNGKLDRRALPAPELSSQDYVAPRTPVENVVAEIWQNVLGVDRVGIHDNFFELGGHSLRATQVISRTRVACGWPDLTVRVLFDAPTVAALSEVIECRNAEVAPAWAGPGAAVEDTTLRAVPRTGALPLSFAQQRLWFMDQLNPGNPAYNLPYMVRFTGELDMVALRRSLNEIVARHEVLRTCFPVRDGQPVQKILPPSGLPLSMVDIAHLKDREGAARALARQEAQLPFDLKRGPLLRALLLRLSPDEHAILLTIHHVVGDGWSLGILVHEFTTLYRAFHEGQSSPLPDLQIQYADFACWQREWMRGATLEAEVEYWRNQLSDLKPLDLLTDFPRPATPSHHGALLPFAISPETAAGLNDLGRRERVTLFMMLAASLQILLGRYSGQDDVCLGTSIANRTRVETEPLVGFFVNQLVLRFRGLHGSVRQLLSRVRDVVLEAYMHQDLPFEHLVDELAPERDLSRPPLYNVLLLLQNAPKESLELPGLRISHSESRNDFAYYDLTFILFEAPEGIRGLAQYRTDLFKEETIARLLGHWMNLLAEISTRPDAPVSDLNLLSPYELETLAQWSSTAPEWPGPHCVHELFTAQAAQSPECVALVYKDQHVTYAALNASANQVAHHLRRLGCGPEARVAVCLERGPDLIASVLGILKAGGAYVPLSPDFPAERLEFVRGDSQALIVVDADTDWERIREESVDDPTSDTHPTNLAYVIYTSGSTGTPKGVGVTHQGFANLAAAQRDFIDLPPGTPILQFYSITFDGASWEWAMALLSTGKLVMASGDELMPGKELIELIRREAIQVAALPPSVLSVLPEDDLPQLHTLVVAAEACPKELVSRWGRDRQMLNSYGPTETTVCATMSGKLKVGEAPEIGKAIRGMRAYVVDERLEPVPVGVGGELCVGGVGVGRGYVKQSGMTAERYVPDGLSGERGERLYRTGDRAKWDERGRLHYLGRRDDQVKVRGYRVELGEVEAVVRGQAGVAQCAVIVREGTLVAYVTGEEGYEVRERELREEVKKKLPGYMVPGEVVVLERMPVTRHGKVDRQALERVERVERVGGAGRGKRKARSAVEEIVQGIWEEVLGREEIGVEENFFEIGGHSLLATQVMSRIRAAFGVEIALRALFERATISELSEEVEKAKEEGREEGRGVRAPSIERASRGSELPLSFAQQRLWFLEQLEPGTATYNCPAAVRLRGELKLGALERSLSEIERRHEVLRTRFVEREGQREGQREGEVVQKVEQARGVRVSVIDVSGLECREEAAREIVREEAGRGFDLSKGPMMRVRLLRMGESDHVLMITMHHIVSDGWSVGIFIKEFRALYEAEEKGEGSPLEELAIQYGDYSQWQREWLRGEVLEQQVAYWRRHLEGLAPLDLPTDHSRPAAISHRGKTVQFKLPAELSLQLKALSRKESATLYMTMLAAFQILLGRYAGQRDVAVGTPIANRQRLETESLIGLFSNMLVLRTDLSGAPAFDALLRRVRHAVLDSDAHQDVPFETLVEELAPDRNLGRTPFFQVVFAIENRRAVNMEMPGLRLGSQDWDYETAKFDLTIFIGDRGEALTGAIEYATDLFEPQTIERLIGHYRSLLEWVVANSDSAITEAAILPAAERDQLLFEWNDTARRLPRACVHELFAARAGSDPDARAVAFENEVLTYGELERRSNQLAWYLRRRGVSLESRVAVCVERSVEMVIALLGTLKAGAAYVPLDPGYPAARLEQMVNDAGASLMVTEARLRDRLPKAAECVCLDADLASILCESEESPATECDPNNLAYIIYTSGSTGHPKGVAVTHRAIVRLVRETDFAQLDCADVVLQFAPISFDASTFEIWGPLLNGGTLAVFAPFIPSLTELADEIERHGVTTLWLTAGLFHEMVDEDLTRVGAVRLLLAGGDVLSPSHVRKALKSLPQCTLVNGYGPTENTTFTCCYRMTQHTHIGDRVPLGKQIANTQVYLIDIEGQLAPTGVFGDLCAGGEGLARGYHGNASFTAERFTPNPFAREPGERLYRTGDRARRRSDGEVEFWGRLDRQVKVRGYRIEPGEIEAALAGHPDVRQAAIIAMDDPGGKRLVAYLVPEPASVVRAPDLRGYLSAHLPDYMQPSAFVFLDNLPLTLNGKLDREALPAVPVFAGSDRHEPPRTPTEELLSHLWSDVLQRDRIGVNENFFEIGGHSLMATQVVSRVRATFGLNISLRALFLNPTIAGLAGEIDSLWRKRESLNSPPMLRVNRGGPLPLSFSQERLWFADQLNAGNPAYNVPFALRLRGLLDHNALEYSLSEIVRRHEVLRTRFTQVKGEPMQEILEATPQRVPIVDLSGLADDERHRAAQELASAEMQRRFDLARGSLMRVLLLRLNPNEQILLLTLHHIVSDGWSIGILVREFRTLYSAALGGRPSQLDELPVQYADFARWQRDYLQGQVLDAHVAYWRSQLEGLPELHLRTDHAAPLASRGNGATVPISLSPALTSGLRALSREKRVTLFMTLLAALQVLVFRHTGQEDFAIGTSIANRNRLETEGLVGFFLNHLVLRSRLEARPTFQELLGRVQQTVLDAYTYQDLPFNTLVEALSPERGVSRSPLFRILFVLQNAPSSTLDLPGLELEQVQPADPDAKFDLSLFLNDDAARITGSFHYNRDLFERSTVARMAQQFEMLLEEFNMDPALPVSSTLLMDVEAERQLISAFSDRLDQLEV